MPTYRVYRLDGAGKISAADWIDAFDDDDAQAKAHQRCDSGSFELWDRERLVVRVRPEQH